MLSPARFNEAMQTWLDLHRISAQSYNGSSRESILGLAYFEEAIQPKFDVFLTRFSRFLEESLQDSTRRRIIALQQRLVRIQTQCIVTRDSIDARAQRCSVLESSIRTLNAFHDHGTFVAWRSLVSRMWHQVRRTVDWTEVRGLKVWQWPICRVIYFGKGSDKKRM